MYVSDKGQLEAFCARARSQQVVAVDTEFLRERTYHPRLCLVQVATKDEIAAIDPLAIDDLSSLAGLLADPEVTKVVHACTQDLEAILSGVGCAMAPVFDTQLAAAFLGLRQQVSLGGLVEAYTGVHLAKAESLTDWSRRPLDEKQLRYAEDDVRYLIGIYERMIERLSRMGRLGWLEPEMAELTDVARVRRVPEEAYRHLKRVGSLTRRQLAVAREVCAWRERLAAQRDVPRKWVLSDEIVAEVCKRGPRDVARLTRIRGTEQLSRRDAEAVVAAVRRGLDCPAQDCPRIESHGHPSAEAEGVIDLMYGVVRVVSEHEGIATQLIATRDDLADFVADQGSSRLSQGWRHEVAGRLLARLLAGEVGLTVKGGRIELL